MKFTLKNSLRSTLKTAALCAVLSGFAAKAQPTISFSQTAFLATPGQALTISPQVPAALAGVPLNCSAASSLPPGLSLNPSTCQISGTIPLGLLPSGDFLFSVQLSSPFLQSATMINITAVATYAIQFPSAPYVITAGQVVRLVPTISGYSSGQPVNCQIASGTLPPGLSIDSSTCVISGTIPYGILPPQTVSFQIGISAQNLVTPANLTLWASDQYAIAFANNSLQVTAGHAFSVAPVTKGFASGQPLACNLSGSLPPGLSYNSTTCVISGTIPYGVLPLQTMQFPVTITSPFVVNPINLTFWASDQYVLSFASTNYQVLAGQAVNIVPATSGFASGQPLGCNLSGSLPPGLALNPATCAISGTIPYGVLAPQAMQFSVGISSQFLANPVNLMILAADRYVIAFSAASYQVNSGRAVNIVPRTSGFAAGESLNCNISSGSLPPGLTLDPRACSISGTIPAGIIPPGGQEIQLSIGSQYLLQPIALTLLAL